MGFTGLWLACEALDKGVSEHAGPLWNFRVYRGDSAILRIL